MLPPIGGIFDLLGGLGSAFGGAPTATPAAADPINGPQAPAAATPDGQPLKPAWQQQLEAQGLSLPQDYDPAKEARRNRAKMLLTMGAALGTSKDDFIPALTGALAQGGSGYIDDQRATEEAQRQQQLAKIKSYLGWESATQGKPTDAIQNFQYSQQHPEFNDFISKQKSAARPNPQIQNFEYSQQHPEFNQFLDKFGKKPAGAGPKVPPGYMLGQDGASVVPLKGGPADPEAVATKIARLAKTPGSVESQRVQVAITNDLKRKWNELGLAGGLEAFGYDPEKYQAALSQYQQTVKETEAKYAKSMSDGDAAPEAAPAPSGVDKKPAAVDKKPTESKAGAYSVGQTATNPTTGAKIRWDGTQWTPVP